MKRDRGRGKLNPPGLLEALNRATLSTQAAAAIRKAVEEGLWREHLPGERRLCEYFQVSRPTIRVALQELAREGLVEIRQGRRNRLIEQSRGAGRMSGKRSRLVGVIAPEPASHFSLTAHQLISELQVHLAENGFGMEILVCPPGGARARLRAVENFVRQNRVFCCLVVSASREVQQWFAQRSLPALVLGSCHEAVKLPSFDVDYRSVCRHAAGIFLGKGHRRLAVVVQDSGFAGDLASESGFCEGVDHHSGPGTARAVVIRHNGSASNLTAQLDALFNSERAPTALLVAPRPWAAFTAIVHLLRRGFAVPDAVSVIARDQDPLFENVDPPIAHYRFEGNAFARRLSRLMLKLVSEGYLAPKPTLLIPEYFAGGTVKRRAKLTPATGNGRADARGLSPNDSVEM